MTVTCDHKPWFPYRCICRVCRTKKIHRTATNLWKPPAQMLNTKETTDICPMNFFRTTDTTDTTDTTIWKPGLRVVPDAMYLLSQIKA